MTRVSTAFAAAAALAAVALAEMKTTNAMPPPDCDSGACKQGALFADAMRWNAVDEPLFSYFVGDDLGGDGWDAGIVSDDAATEMYKYSDTQCSMKLRGVTIIRMMNAMVQSDHVDGNTDSWGEAPVLQYDTLRVKYSTTLPADKRLLAVDFWDKGTSEFKPVNRTALYTVGVLKYDHMTYSPYKQWTSTPDLEGEKVECQSVKMEQGDLVKKFLESESPYTIPEVTDRLVGEAGDTAMVVEQDAAICKAMAPPHKFVATLASCVACSAGQVSTGTECEAPVVPVTESPATESPITDSPVTDSPVTDSPVTESPATESPVTESPATDSPATDSPATEGPLTQAPASVPTSGSASGGAVPASAPSGAVTASGAGDAVTAAPTGGATTAPVGGASQGGGAAGGGAGTKSGSSIGVIVGVVVGVIALIAVVAVVAFFVMRNRGAGAGAMQDGLDDRLEPLDKDDADVSDVI